MAATLEITTHKGTRFSFSLKDELRQWVLGLAPDCSIKFPPKTETEIDRTISRKHCSITKTRGIPDYLKKKYQSREQEEKDIYILFDGIPGGTKKSSNGLYIKKRGEEKKRVEIALLEHGDIFYIGKQIIEFYRIFLNTEIKTDDKSTFSS